MTNNTMTPQEHIQESLRVLLESKCSGESMKAWLEELEAWGMKPQDVKEIDIAMEIRLHPDSTQEWKKSEPTGLKVVTLTYENHGGHFRVFNEKWEHVTVKQWVR